MQILLLSQNFPPDVKTRVYGVYQRLDMFAVALAGLGSMNALLFAPYDASICRAMAPELSRLLSENWGTQVHLTLVPRKEPLEAPAFFPGFSSTRTSRIVEALDQQLARGPDLIFAHRLGMMAPLAATKKRLPPIFFDLDDVEHVKLQRLLRVLPRRRDRLLQMHRIFRSFAAEYRAVACADRTFVCSEKDRRYLSRKMRSDAVVTVPNAVTIPDPVQCVPSDATLLFLGTYVYEPNIQAAELLIHRIWPHIKNRIPGARLIIGGPYSERIPTYRQPPPGVEFTGFVDDVSELYAHARIVCCPLLIGGGTRIKILEAAAFGKPVVSTSIGAEGLDLRDGRELLIRDRPDAFADACVALLTDRERCSSIGAAARQRVRKLYARPAAIRSIREHVVSALTAAG